MLRFRAAEVYRPDVVAARVRRELLRYARRHDLTLPEVLALIDPNGQGDRVVRGAGQQDRAVRAGPDHVLGHPGRPVVLVAEHDEVHVQLLGALQDGVGRLVLGGLDQLAVHLDARRGQGVHRVLHHLPLPDVHVVLGHPDPEPGRRR